MRTQARSPAKHPPTHPTPPRPAAAQVRTAQLPHQPGGPRQRAQPGHAQRQRQLPGEPRRRRGLRAAVDAGGGAQQPRVPRGARAARRLRRPAHARPAAQQHRRRARAARAAAGASGAALPVPARQPRGGQDPQLPQGPDHRPARPHLPGRPPRVPRGAALRRGVVRACLGARDACTLSRRGGGRLRRRRNARGIGSSLAAYEQPCKFTAGTARHHPAGTRPLCRSAARSGRAAAWRRSAPSASACATRRTRSARRTLTGCRSCGAPASARCRGAARHRAARARDTGGSRGFVLHRRRPSLHLAERPCV